MKNSLLTEKKSQAEAASGRGGHSSQPVGGEGKERESRKKQDKRHTMEEIARV